jgi:lipoyl(octanoyl) transferase
VTRSARILRPAGPVPYDDANVAMHALAEARVAGDDPLDTLILLEHPPVYTAGRSWKPDHILRSEEQIIGAGAELRTIDRGGSFTFHGPGQLVGYVVMDLGVRPDAMRFVRDLEEVVIEASADIGVPVHRSDVQTGVWSGRAKVCAIGVRLMRMRVSLHGFAVNCTTDLSWFDAIVPCGLPDEGVTSLSELAGREVSVEEMAPLVARRFEEVFDLRLSTEETAWPSSKASIAAASSA